MYEICNMGGMGQGAMGVAEHTVEGLPSALLLLLGFRGKGCEGSTTNSLRAVHM